MNQRLVFSQNQKLTKESLTIHKLTQIIWWVWVFRLTIFSSPASTCARALLGGNNIQSKVAKELNVDTNVVSSALSISNETDTQIISISATTTDPQLSKKIVDTTVDVFTNEVKETLNINNITTVDDAKLQTSPVSPSVPKNIVIGGLVGAILSIGIIFIRFMLDNRLHTKEDVEKYLEIPNLGVIPYFED